MQFLGWHSDYVGEQHAKHPDEPIVWSLKPIATLFGKHWSRELCAGSLKHITDPREHILQTFRKCEQRGMFTKNFHEPLAVAVDKAAIFDTSNHAYKGTNSNMNSNDQDEEFFNPFGLFDQLPSNEPAQPTTTSRSSAAVNSPSVLAVT